MLQVRGDDLDCILDMSEVHVSLFRMNMCTKKATRKPIRARGHRKESRVLKNECESSPGDFFAHLHCSGLGSREGPVRRFGSEVRRLVHVYRLRWEQGHIARSAPSPA